MKRRLLVVMMLCASAFAQTGILSPILQGAPAAGGTNATFDSIANGQTGSGTSISYTVTLSANSNMACVVWLSPQVTTISAISVTVGGVSASAISGAASPPTSSTTLAYGVALGNVTGSKTVSISWTTTSAAASVTECFSHANQTTPFNNGTQQNSGFSSGTASLAITSTSGDLTTDYLIDVAGSSVSAPTQTQKALVNFTSLCASTNTCVGVSIGPGTGTTTHQWTTPGGDTYSHSGVNVAHQ